MKKAKLFMMLALLVMGVSNVFAGTKDYYVNYEREFIEGGYSFDASKSNRITKIETFGSLTSLGTQEVGDRMIRVTYSDQGWGNYSDAHINYELAGELLKCITAKDLPNYTENVWIYRSTSGGYSGGNTVYITYQYSRNDYTTWTSGNFTYSTLYTKTNTTNVKNTIKLPDNQCAIQLNRYNQTEVTIPQTDPQKGYKVVALQTYAMCENESHTLSMNPTGCNTNYRNATNDHSNGTLRTVKFTKTSNVRSIGDYAFCSCHALTTIEIPQSVEYLGEATFSQCIGLTDGLTFERTSGASFTTGIKVIRNYTFWNCRNMTSLELPDGIIVIEGQQSGSSMQYMINLTHLRLPNTLVAVGPHFLCDASSLPEVTIPASVKYIDGACFHGCEKLREVYLLGPASALQGVYDGSDTFDENPTLCKDNVQKCVFITTQENIRGYMEDENGVWQKIADNRQGCDKNGVWAVKVDEEGHIVRDASGNLVFEMDENNQHVYLKYADGTNVKATACGNGWGNALTYLPDQKMTFTPGKWVTVIFPKAYTQDELKATFGNEVVLAKMTGFLSPDWSVVNGKRTYHLNFTQQTAADANTPYMIKPGQKNGTNPYDVTMIAASEMDDAYRAELTRDHALSIEASDNSEVIMYGWFKKRNMKQWEFYFMNPANSQGQYNTACVFKRIVDPAQAPTIKAFRCYWRIWLEGEAQDAGAGAKSAFFRFADDNETTGIEEVESKIGIEFGIYDLNGRKLDLKKEDLPKGLFIINGKKVMINK